MKKLFVSAGLVAIGTASLHADVYAPDITTMNASKMWSVSGSLRGFYDDNYTTSHSPSTGKKASWGAEFTPSLSLVLPLQQTELGFKYTYGLYYYADRSSQGQDPFDQSHQAAVWIDHAFTERWEAKVQDTFTASKEPQLSTTSTAVPYRATGDNLQNVATATVHTEWSALVNSDLGYQNTWYDYRQHGATTLTVGNGAGATYAGLLNQDDHTIWLNLNYQYLPDLSFQVGDSFSLANYTGNEPIAQDPVTGNFYQSHDRDQLSDSLYIGGQFAFTENLSMSAQVGASIVDSYNLPSFDHGQSSSQVQPYATIAATYTYLPGDYAQIGFTQSSAPTDVSTVNGTTGQLTLYQESSVIYGSINHQITPYLVASVIGHYEYSYYVGGQFDGGTQNWYTLGLNLTYTVNMFLSVEAGYNFDYYVAGLAQPSYTRNVEYVGLTASF